ncbi:MAG: pantetheine-phosphate adenylyltransferase, partial [Mycetocola sp.]
MDRIAVVPGSFDPITVGHCDVIERAVRLYDTVHVLVVHNPSKNPLLTVEERVDLVTRSLAERGITSVVVASWSEGLLVDYVRDVGAQVLVKGIRSQVDVVYETPMAIVNRNLAGV